MKIGIIVIMLLVLVACGRPPHEETEEQHLPDDPLHAILTIDHETFINAVSKPRRYEIPDFLVAGVVPHHITAATMISGFFAQAASFADYFDLIIVLGPNHFQDLGDIVLSYRDWGVGEGVVTHRGFVEDALTIDGITTTIGHHNMEADHAISILIPFIYHYMPNTMVAPMLLNSSLTFGQTMLLYDWLMEWIDASGLRVFLLASIDFSHYLTPPEARQRDAITTAAILDMDIELIHSLSSYYLDSNAAMIIFIKYLQSLGLYPQIIDHTDASEFLGPWLEETTSYKIIIGRRGTSKNE